VVILEEFDPVEVLETVDREAVTMINLVPTHLAEYGGGREETVLQHCFP